MDTPCPQCNAATTPGSKFCGQCGYDLTRSASSGGFEPVAGLPKHEQATAPKAEKSEKTEKKKDFAKTVMDAGPPPAALAHLMQQSTTGGPSDAGGDAKPAKSVQKTMLGMAAVPPGGLPTSPASAGSTPSGESTKKSVQKTMMGMAAVPPGAMAEPPTDPSPSPAPKHEPSLQSPQSPQSPSAPESKPDPKTNRTMLGVAVPLAPQPSPAAAPQSVPKGVPAAQSNRTMLGQPATAPPGQLASPPPQVAPQSSPGAFTPDPSMSDMSIAGLPRKRRSGVPWVGILIGLGLLLGVAAGGAWWLFGRGPELRASIANSAEGEVLQVDVPGVPEGTKVRFQGREAMLEAGRAVFPLAANDLQLGDNTLTVDVVSPDGTVEQGSVVLSVKYRVRADLNSLQNDPPTLRILVDAKPGSSVTIDERNVELDPTGHGFVDLPIDPQAEANVYERSISYRVVVDGEPASGTVETQVPFATLQIDRPGTTTVTDEARIELAGAAHPESTVTLDGVPLETTEGRFVSHLEMPELGEKDFTLVARRPGRAPRARVLHVQRVEDLEAHAASFPVDASLTYARITQNPESYSGQSAAFVGRVYNVDVHQGQTVLQIVVRDCPRGQRCPMWVTFDGASSAENNSWVRVVGRIGGEQQFRSPSGQVLSVPRLDAVFVLPIDAGRR